MTTEPHSCRERVEVQAVAVIDGVIKSAGQLPMIAEVVAWLLEQGRQQRESSPLK